MRLGHVEFLRAHFRNRHLNGQDWWLQHWRKRPGFSPALWVLLTQKEGRTKFRKYLL